MSINLAQFFCQQAEAHPEHPVILGPHEHSCISYGAFQTEIQRLAEQLQTAGIHSGMNIGLHYPSGQAYIAFIYALWICGACVTLDYLIRVFPSIWVL